MPCARPLAPRQGLPRRRDRVEAPHRLPYHAAMKRRRHPSRDAGDPTDQYLVPEQQRPTGRGHHDEEDDFDEPGVVVTHSLATQHSIAQAPGRDIDRLPGQTRAAAVEPPTPPPPARESQRAEEEVAATQEAPAAPNAALPARSQPDAEAESAETATPSTRSPGARFSPDGEWWWNGASWLAAISHDGLWRWDGTDWLLRVDSGLEPERLVEDLNKLADVRYRRGGLLLARHANEWPVPPNLTQPVAEATEILEQRVATERRLQGPEALAGGKARQRGGLLARVAGRNDDQQRLRVELGKLNTHLEVTLLRIGREAPVPTFGEADEVLETARHLTAAAREMTAAHEAVLAAQADWQARVGVATADLEECIARRDVRIGLAEVGVREAEARREQRIADAWRRLAEVRMPRKGEHLASFGPIHLFAAQIEMPNGEGPTWGARAVIGSAAELTEAEPRALDALFLVGDGGATALHRAEASGDPTPFLLVVTTSRLAVVTCGENEEGEARRFAREVATAAATADAMREARKGRLPEVREAVQQADDDRSEIEAANAHRTATGQDPVLLESIEAARDRVALERGETTGIDQTGAELQGVLDRLTTAPPPLPTAGAS